MYHVYVLYFCDVKKFYIGYTADLKRRIGEHQSGRGFSTVRLGCFDLIFYESFLNKADALRREGYFKTTKGKKSLKLILRESLGSG
jgi:putative endonuclease